MKRYILTGIICFATCLVLGMKFQDSYSLLLDSLYDKTVPLISISEMEKLTSSGDLVIIDTREEKEFAVSHLRGAIRVENAGEMSQVANLSKDQQIVVYCSVGYRSERLGEQLLANGFTNVQNLYGGIFQWVNEGNEVINQKNMPTDSVHTYDKNWSIWLNRGVRVYE